MTDRNDSEPCNDATATNSPASIHAPAATAGHACPPTRRYGNGFPESHELEPSTSTAVASNEEWSDGPRTVCQPSSPPAPATTADGWSTSWRPATTSCHGPSSSTTRSSTTADAGTTTGDCYATCPISV